MNSYLFTSGNNETTTWGGAATTPESSEEMSSQQAKHAGSIAALLILHIFQQCIQMNFKCNLWIDNAEVIRRGEEEVDKRGLRNILVFILIYGK